MFLRLGGFIIGFSAAAAVGYDKTRFTVAALANHAVGMFVLRFELCRKGDRIVRHLMRNLR